MWALIPATYEEASYFISRLLAHFPRGDASKDAVVLSDLCADIVEQQISLCAVARVCKEAWQASTRNNPWLPPSGQLIKDMLEEMKTWSKYLDEIQNPSPPAIKAEAYEPLTKGQDFKKYGGAADFEHMSPEMKHEFLADMKEYEPFLRDFNMKIWHVPEDVWDKFIAGGS